MRARLVDARGAAWCALAVALATSTAHAQDEEVSGAATVTTSALMILEGDATAGQGATVGIGLRRGLADVDGVRFVHPVDVLSPSPYSEEVQLATDELDPLADQVRDGDAEDVAQRVRGILETFEANLESVRREQLVDAYMLAAVARCRLRRQRECEEGFERVIVFREGHEYDATRYPAEYGDVFERVRARTLSSARGSLEVVTEPEGAEVYIDGRSYGPSPVRADGLLAGDHYVTIKHLGFEKIIRRATVSRTRSTVRYELAPNERSRLVSSPEAQAAIRAELGQERAGPNLRSLGSTLGATQIIVGVVASTGTGELHVQVWLYDMRTRFLLSTREATLTSDEVGMEQARQLAIELYQGVDRSGAVEAPPEEVAEQHERQPELYEQWWFWTIIGVVAVSGGVAIGAAASSSGVPDGWTRVDVQLP